MVKNTFAIITEMPFWAENSGGLVRLSNVIRYFSPLVDITVLYFGGLSAQQLQSIECQYRIQVIPYRNPFFGIWSTSFGNKIILLPKLVRGYMKWKFGVLIGHNSAREDRRVFVRTILKSIKPKFTMVQRHNMAALIDGIDKSYLGQTMIDTHDVLSERTSSSISISNGLSAADEVELLNQFDYVIAINSRDASIFSDIGVVSNKIIVVSHGCEVTHLPPREGTDLRVGYFAKNNTHNFRAIADFIQYVWPDVVKQVPAKLMLAGSLSEQRGDELAILGKHIYNLGFVDDIKSLYQGVDVIINPIQEGTGLKIKNVEALCYGKPLLTTSVGAQGMEDGIGEGFWVADEWADMKGKMLVLCKDQSVRDCLCNNGIRYAEDTFSSINAYKNLEKMIV